MTTPIDLKKIERKAWTSYLHDGLWDIFLGLLMLTGGIRALTDNAWFTLVILASVLVIVVGKRLITTPRLGHVKFSPARKVKQHRLIAVIGISVIAMGVLLWLATLGVGLPKTASAPIVVILVALVFGLIAYYMDFRRLYAYGLLFAIAMALWETLGDPTGPIASSVSGGIALLIGLVMLIRFIRKYPKMAQEVYNDHAD